jgi:hypothetical protein
MTDPVPFFALPKSPAAPRAKWLLAEDGDGSMHVLHQWNYPEIATRPYSGTGRRRLSLSDFFRSEASDTAKLRLRDLLMEKGHGSRA